MKTLSIILALAALVYSRAAAQVTMELGLDQEEFLPGETIPLAVKITNQSGQQVHLGTEPGWLTFDVEAVDGFMVQKNAEVPVMGEFDLESSQMGTKHVDLGPYFILTRPGRYSVSATMHIKAWGMTVTSPVKTFDVITGAPLWTQDFGVPKTSGMPEMRRYTLEQASYLHSQMRLYMELSDPGDARVIKTTSLGQAVSFSRPEAQVDRQSLLHVLWQSGSQSFDYCLVSPDGELLDREIYDDLNSRPRLAVDDNGAVLVKGGVRRPKPGDLPEISAPVQMQPTSTPAAK